MSATAESLNDRPVVPPVMTTVDYPKSRLFYWSVRRELWENRSIYLAPLLVALVMLCGFAIGARRLAEAARALFMLDAQQQAELLMKPLALTATPIIITASLVALFYCLDALHGERRDRSILFWKSLPVSDLVTVLSKAVVPLLILPVIACATFMVLQLVILAIGSAVLLANGLDGTVLWTGAPLIRTWGSLIYGTFAVALWYAPIYGWLLLVSGWARRSTFLWAVLPPLALCLVEKIAFDTTYLSSLLKHRLFGVADNGFHHDAHDQIIPDPLALLVSPDLLIGLVVAVLFLAAAVWFRRYQQPI
jgi:ABC-2 type transport system permease protein